VRWQALPHALSSLPGASFNQRLLRFESTRLSS